MKLKLKEYLLPLPPGIRTFMILKSKLFFIACFLDESAPPPHFRKRCYVPAFLELGYDT